MTMYKYYPEMSIDDELLWKVLEVSSDQIVAEFFFEEDALKMCEFYDKGGGFAGFTPSFMLQKMKINTNDAFAMKFS